MKIEALGQPAHAAYQDGLLRPGERLVVEDVVSGRHMLVRVSQNPKAPLWDARHGVMVASCVVILAGPLDAPSAPG